MKSNQYILVLFLLTSILGAACTENLAGLEEAGASEAVANISFSKGMADLSLNMTVSPDTYSIGEYSFAKVTAYLMNDGPNDASGIQIAIFSETPCWEARADSTKEDNGPDGIIWDIDSAGVNQTNNALAVECLLNGQEIIELGVEILRSDLADPDSTPGNGAPEEDDQTQVRLYPEVPPCPDCPFALRWDFW